MLELDLLLQGFLAHGYDGLDVPDKELFAEVVLALPDTELHDFLLGVTVPEDKDVARVIESIRAAQD